MPMPAPIRPRAPDDACARSAAVDSGARPRSALTRLSAPTRSPAVSASVPSRSNRIAAAGNRRGAERNGAVSVMQRGLAKRHQVIDGHVVLETITSRQRVVRHSNYLDHVESDATAPRGNFRGLEKARPIVRALRQQLQYVFGAHDCIKIRFRIAVEC